MLVALRPQGQEGGLGSQQKGRGESRGYNKLGAVGKGRGEGGGVDKFHRAEKEGEGGSNFGQNAQLYFLGVW